MADVTLPQLGETVTEGTITQWFKAVGDSVEIDEPLFEVSTDKVDSEVPSPASGVVIEIRVPEGETVDVGTVLAIVGDASDAPAPAPAAASAPEPEPESPDAPAPSSAAETSPAPDPPAPGKEPGLVLSPIVRTLADDRGVDTSAISGSGAGGRVTRADIGDGVQDEADGQHHREIDPAP